MSNPASIPRSVDALWLKGLQDLYSTAGSFSRESLAAFYTEDAVLIDPVHQVRGLPAMQDYFNHVYGELISCQFSFEHHAQTGNQLFISWQMDFRHPRLQNGKRITVPGSSHLQLDDNRITFHRDYYDVGAMLYDNIPLLGQITGLIKRRLAR